MAGAQFTTPRPVHPSKVTKRFTLAEANRTLPLVRRVVADVVRVHDRVTALAVQRERGPAKEQQSAQNQFDAAVEQLQAYLEELRSIGCQLKDYQAGLVDFPASHQGRDICLCWKLGEETISHWHEMDAGFDGRQPIALLQPSH